MPVLLTTRRARNDLQDEKLFTNLLGKAGGPLIHRKFFGQVSYPDLIASSVLSIFAYDSDNPEEVKAFLGIGDTSNGKFDTHALLEWAIRYYEGSGIDHQSLGKNLFLKALLVDEKYEKEAIEAVLHAAFDLIPEVDTLLLHILKSVEGMPRAATQYFRELSRGPDTKDLKYHDTFITYKFLTCHRKALLSKLQVRKACIEDHDDLIVSVFEQQEALTSTRGDSFIEAQDQHNRAIVGVLASKAVGLIAITSAVNLSLTQKCFNLDAHDGLIKVDPETGEVQSNVAAIQLFGLKESYASRARDLLPMAFEFFPEQQYLLITLPTTSRTSPSLLAPFSLVYPKPTSIVSHAVYVLHRDTLLATEYLQVKRYTSVDHDAVHKLVQTLCGDVELLQTNLKAIKLYEQVALKDNPAELAFIITIAEQLVGIFICGAALEATLAHLHLHYKIEGVIPYPSLFHARDISICKSFIANPLILAHTPLILREIMRQAGKKAILHQTKHVPASLRHVMLPIRPRRLAVSLSSKPSLAAANQMLYAVTTPRLSEPRQPVHTRIVIIGGSTAAIALLEELLFDDKHDYLNLILVSPSGLHPEIQSPVAGFVQRDADWPTHKEFYASGLRHNVRVITALMVDLIREKKVIILARGKKLNYDVLVLATGLQDAVTPRLARLDHKTGSYLLPKGVYSPSRPHLCTTLDSSLQVAANNDQNVLIYGSDPQAFTIVQGVLKAGIKPENVMLATPLLEGNQAILCDVVVDEVILSILAALGIHVHWGMKLQSLVTTSENILRGVKFLHTEEGEDRVVELPASILLVNQGRDVDPFLFHAVNECGLVYDGRLVIDKGFRTVDPCIYAGGPLTKFTRSFRRGVSLEHYSSREIGQQIAWAIRDDLAGLTPEEREPLQPLVEAPARTLFLPTGLHYFHIHSLVDPTTKDEEGIQHASVISTGSPSHDLIAKGGRYLSMSFDSLGRIQGLTYLGKEALDARLFLPLIGLQDTYLKGAIEKLEREHVEDWITYLKQGWTGALFHENFASFTRSLKALLQNDHGAKEIVHQLLGIAAERKDDETIQKTCKHLIGAKGSSLREQTRKMIETETLGFLKHNSPSLPQYHQQS